MSSVKRTRKWLMPLFLLVWIYAINAVIVAIERYGYPFSWARRFSAMNTSPGLISTKIRAVGIVSISKVSRVQAVLKHQGYVFEVLEPMSSCLIAFPGPNFTRYMYCNIKLLVVYGDS